MIRLLPDLKRESKDPLYIQLCEYIKNAIARGDIPSGERLPSLRSLADSLSVSVTTVELAYAQLAVEGYIRSRQRSGYYVSVPPGSRRTAKQAPAISEPLRQEDPAYRYDLSTFDFAKWKKCYGRVVSEHPEWLLFEADPAGEAALRYEISRYVYESRGVRCAPEQIFIAAGTGQITAHLCRILRAGGIGTVSVETPGYEPVRRVFSERGFVVVPIPVTPTGIRIEKLPANLPGAVYVNPSRQFPTGAVMPVGRRYELLQWAEANDSYIIEDDYDSELRYFGNPIPALQGLDETGRVLYLGSFSSTLFPAARISYMVLPPALAEEFAVSVRNYPQSCSKAEQLALALFMEEGHYRKGIAKLRRSYAAKMEATLKALSGEDWIRPVEATSGISLLLEIRTDRTAKELCALAAELGLEAFEADLPGDHTAIGVYYTRPPLTEIPSLWKKLLARWRAD